MRTSYIFICISIFLTLFIGSIFNFWQVSYNLIENYFVNLNNFKDLISYLGSFYGVLFGFLLTSFSILYSYRDNIFGETVKDDPDYLKEFIIISFLPILVSFLLVLMCFFLLIGNPKILVNIFISLSFFNLMLLFQFFFVLYIGLH